MPAAAPGAVCGSRRGRPRRAAGPTSSGSASRSRAAVTIAELDGRYLSTEVAGGFTGRVIGMYAAAGIVHFDWFELRRLGQPAEPYGAPSRARAWFA